MGKRGRWRKRMGEVLNPQGWGAGGAGAPRAIAPPPPPPIDPRKDPEVMEMLRGMMTIAVGPEEMPVIPVGLMGVVVDGDGVWQIREGLSVSQVVQLGKAHLPFPQLGYAEGIHIPAPLPVHLLEQTGSLFRWAYQVYKSEAFVRVFWRRTAEGAPEFQLVVPEQQVSGGGVKHDIAETLEGWTHWGDIHSHGGMDTFWSGVDDNDEKRFEGRLFGVMGKWGDAWPKSRWRARLGGQFIDLPLDTILGGATLSFRGKVPYAKMLDGGGKVEMQSGSGLTMFPPEGFPEEWKARVTENKGYRAVDDRRYNPHGGRDDFSHGRGGTLIGASGTGQGSNGYSSPEAGRSQEHVNKLIRRARLILAGGEKGKVLWASDPSRASWFVDSKLQVWYRATPQAPLTKTTNVLAEMLRANTPMMSSIYLLKEGAV